MIKRAKNQTKSSTLLVAGIVSVLAFVILIVSMGMFFNTKTYWVLNQSVQARTQITSDMLEAREVSAGGIPDTAISKEQIEKTPLYSKVDMAKGEPVTVSTVGNLAPVSKGIPKNFTVASLSLSPVNANLGAIKAGDSINIYKVSEDSGDRKAVLVMQNVKVLNAASSVETANSKQGNKGGSANSDAASSVNTVYQLAVSPENAANLAVLALDSSNLYVTPTPASGAISGSVSSTIDAFNLNAEPIDGSAGK